MSKSNGLKSKITDFLKTAKSQWHTPGEGKYVSYKEMAAYSVGGAGVYFIISLVGKITLDSGSMIVGPAIGLELVDIQTINVIVTLLMLLIAPTRAMLFDNTRSKMGKFRPYLLYMGVPTALLGTLFVYLPYETMEYSHKFYSVLIVYTLLQICSPFYLSAYSSLVQVLSPNSSERSWIIGISSIIYSFAPTVVNPAVRLIGSTDDLHTYRIAFPLFCTIGAIISMLCIFGTKEKIIAPRQYVQKMGFIEGFRKVSKNKYFWIMNLSSWVGFLNSSYASLFEWIFLYGMNNKAIHTTMILIKGEAATPGMALSPLLTNKLGKKKIAILSLSVQTVCIGLMLTCYESYFVLFALMFIKDMFGALSIIYLPAMKADIMDYQQYKTGDRIEGFIEQSGIFIGSIISLATGYVMPFILKQYNLTNNFQDLYNADFRNPIIKVVIVCSFIGTLLSIIPFFFYDLSEDKRSNMIRALKIRALFSDYESDKIEDDKLIDAVKEIYNVIELYQSEADGNKKAAYEIAVDEFEKYKNEKPDLWKSIEEKYALLTLSAESV